MVPLVFYCCIARQRSVLASGPVRVLSGLVLGCVLFDLAVLCCGVMCECQDHVNGIRSSQPTCETPDQRDMTTALAHWMLRPQKKLSHPSRDRRAICVSTADPRMCSHPIKNISTCHCAPRPFHGCARGIGKSFSCSMWYRPFLHVLHW